MSTELAVTRDQAVHDRSLLVRRDAFQSREKLITAQIVEHAINAAHVAVRYAASIVQAVYEALRVRISDRWKHRLKACRFDCVVQRAANICVGRIENAEQVGVCNGTCRCTCVGDQRACIAELVRRTEQNAAAEGGITVYRQAAACVAEDACRRHDEVANQGHAFAWCQKASIPERLRIVCAGTCQNTCDVQNVTGDEDAVVFQRAANDLRIDERPEACVRVDAQRRVEVGNGQAVDFCKNVDGRRASIAERDVEIVVETGRLKAVVRHEVRRTRASQSCRRADVAILEGDEFSVTCCAPDASA